MEETYPTKGIILNKKAFKESDSKVSFFSVDKGRLELVVRGTGKIKSKLSGHTEPFSLSNIMVIKGKSYDYVGGALSSEVYYNIKNDFDKTLFTSKLFNKFLKLVKGEESREAKDIYFLLKFFLEEFDECEKDILKYENLYNAFLLKLLFILGYELNLSNCVLCGESPFFGDIHINFNSGGIVCQKCANKSFLKISKDNVKILKFFSLNEFSEIKKIKLNKKTVKEVSRITGAYYQYFID
jgi:DNA repair protein RecO (recombination protein O)